MNYHYVTEGPSEDAFRAGLGKVIELAAAQRAEQIGLAVHQLSILQGVVRNVLGEAADQLRGGEHKASMDVNGEREFELCVITARIQPRPFEGPVLAAFVSMDELRTLDGMDGCTDIVLAPQSAAEAAEFAAEFDSEELPLAN